MMTSLNKKMKTPNNRNADIIPSGFSGFESLLFALVRTPDARAACLFLCALKTNGGGDGGGAAAGLFAPR